MNKEELDAYRKLETWQLYEFVADREFSPRKKAALDILEERKMKLVQEAARSSASAAKWSAVAAVISAIAAIVALFLRK